MKTLAFLSLISVLVVSCNYRREKTSEVQSSDLFSLVQKNIIETKCLGCHNGSGSSHVNLSSHASLLASGTVIPFKPRDSRFYLSMESGAMPKGQDRLSDSQLKLVFQWIEQGAKNADDPNPKPKPTPEPEPPPAPTYAWISKYVFARRCTGCHEGKEPEGKLLLTSYEGLMASPGETKTPVVKGDPMTSGLYLQLKADFMPPEEPYLSAEIKKAIHDWILAGAPK